MADREARRPRERRDGADEQRGSRRAAPAPTTARPPETIQAGRAASRPARSRRAPARRRSTAPASQLCQSRRRAVVAVSARSSSSGFTRRISSSGTSAKSSETSRPTATPCTAADAVTPTLVDAERREHARPESRRRPTAASATPSSAAAGREPEHLQHVRREHAPRRRAEALQNRDAPDLLLHDDARDAPDADAAEHDDREADEAQVVLRDRRGSRPSRSSSVRHDRTSTDRRAGTSRRSRCGERVDGAVVDAQRASGASRGCRSRAAASRAGRRDRRRRAARTRCRRPLHAIARDRRRES